ncbi:Maf family protein [Kiloniella laminariae]|uniref:Nucleoside triphosphate pyrophosphatase n=1 Tax=Kiloniella laminariae TaxID=454162 RepID=A0ABT4LJ90_9PROT|nr:Maf family protein [Kiloniella laminariae]MCZ4281183.1 Maf family protein [Kiloniella laminariae]
MLASASKARQQLLENAGVPLAGLLPAFIDEEAVKDSLRHEGASALQVAETLAELKARKVSLSHPGCFVIGADQMLDCNGIWFDKPVDRDHAAAHLQALAGKTHQLQCSVCVVKDGERLWHHNETAALTMRDLDPDFIARYLDAAGDEVLASVGAYQLEGLGAQLFHKVQGDYFTILGLPLLPLLTFLRHNEVLA